MGRVVNWWGPESDIAPHVGCVGAGVLHISSGGLGVYPVWCFGGWPIHGFSRCSGLGSGVRVCLWEGMCQLYLHCVNLRLDVYYSFVVFGYCFSEDLSVFLLDQIDCASAESWSCHSGY